MSCAIYLAGLSACDGRRWKGKDKPSRHNLLRNFSTQDFQLSSLNDRPEASRVQDVQYKGARTCEELIKKANKNTLWDLPRLLRTKTK